MKKTNDYIVKEVREYDETETAYMTKNVSSKHHIVLILDEDSYPFKRCRLDLTEQNSDCRSSEHGIVVAGDRVVVISEIDGFHINYTIKLKQ